MKKKKGLFRHLAWTGIRNNYKLYVPYILAAVGMTAMFYIILALSMSTVLRGMAKGESAGIILALGVYVIGIFAVIFMFYTNSFLIKTRTREFGLYNILGMSRRHIARIVATETLIAAALSIAGGLTVGILFEKLAEILLVKLIGDEATYTLSVNFAACLITAAVFLIIFLLVMLRSMIRVFRLNTIDLLKSENFGEKPPKAKWLMTALGLVILAGAYYLAVVMAAPMQAITMFFFAVIMVIVATNILFVAGSVTICRALQKNKKYYYKTSHFVSLSSMIYRMKRNGAGLASICILSTMVLVMISSTSCLYFGKDASLMARYPRHMAYEVIFDQEIRGEVLQSNEERIRTEINDAVKEQGQEPLSSVEMTMARSSAVIRDGKMDSDISPIDIGINEGGNVWDIYFVSLEDYNRIMGENRVLADDEVICCMYRDKYKYDNITTPTGERFTIADSTEDFFSFGDLAANITPAVVFALNRLPNIGVGDADWATIRWEYLFDIDADEDGQYEVFEAITEKVFNNRDMEAEFGVHWYSTDCRALNRADFFGMYGGLFFLGIALSIVFTFALVLIIYYKQISEGYEDRSRFEIMCKVGMTREDIRKSVNSQMGSVFYMPFVAAVVHLGFALPMIFSMLKLFSVTQMRSLLSTTAISVVVFGIIYTIVYKITSNSYYKLVS